MSTFCNQYIHIIYHSAKYCTNLFPASALPPPNPRNIAEKFQISLSNLLFENAFPEIADSRDGNILYTKDFGGICRKI
jgi:hypothetical protein